MVSRLGKADGVEAYQTGVTYITKTAKPTGWVPGRQIRLRYQFYLNREVDCDNALKAINDAIALGLGVNDKIFLPCVTSKVIDKKAAPCVVVELENIE